MRRWADIAWKSGVAVEWTTRRFPATKEVLPLRSMEGGSEASALTSGGVVSSRRSEGVELAIMLGVRQIILGQSAADASVITAGDAERKRANPRAAQEYDRANFDPRAIHQGCACAALGLEHQHCVGARVDLAFARRLALTAAGGASRVHRRLAGAWRGGPLWRGRGEVAVCGFPRSRCRWSALGLVLVQVCVCVWRIAMCRGGVGASGGCVGSPCPAWWV